jgi:hypothetical protein
MAVQNPRPVIEAEDVVGEQVTMPVADAARRQPRLKQRAAALDVVADQSCPGRQVLRADQLGVGGQRVDVRHPTGQRGGRGAIGLDLRRASGGGMVGGKGAGDRTERVVDQLAAGQQGRHSTVRRHPIHQDQPLTHAAGAVGDGQHVTVRTR